MMSGRLKGYNNYFYTRESSNLVVYPAVKDSEEYQLFYYRRLSDVDARYDVDTDTDGSDTQWYAETRAALITAITDGDTDDDPDLAGQFISNADETKWWVGKEVPNWLRDENEKLILFGALAEAFTYLDEPQQAQKYAQRFDQEITNLNGEENKRKYMGGAITTHYRSNMI